MTSDGRSKTSADNGKLGGRPKELMDWDGGLDGELWKPVPGFERYFASNKGRILSVCGLKPRIMRQHIGTDGMLRVDIWGDRKRKKFITHRLLLMTFVGPCPDDMEASHIDGDVLNNNINNLVWETHTENIRRKEAHGTNLKGDDHPNSILSETQIREIRQKYKPRQYTYQRLADEYRTSAANIRLIVIGQNWKHVN